MQNRIDHSKLLLMSTPVDYSDLITKIHQLIQLGEIQSAQSFLQKVNLPQVPRSHLTELASLSRRANLPQLSLRLLHDVVRPKVDGVLRPASPSEKAEYAMALQKIGALRESLSLARSINPTEEPRALMAQAYVLMSRWEYLEAEPFWQLLAENPALDPYFRLIARVNRIACTIAVGKFDCLEDLDELRKNLREGKFELLSMNCLELAAQLHLGQGRLNEAKNVLDNLQSESEKLEKSFDHLFVLKWKAIIEARVNDTLEPIERIREQALKLKHWETLRDLDYQMALLRPESSWKKWVYYGTPHRSFRKRIENFSAMPNETILSRSGQWSDVLDPWFSREQDASLAHRTFAFLIRDFYRPTRTAEIFSELFPDEYYNPDSSPARVYKAIERTRGWIEKQNLNLNLLSDENEYALRFAPDFGFLVRSKLIEYGGSSFLFLRSKGMIEEPFDQEAWAKQNEISLSAAQKQISNAVKDGVLSKEKLGVRSHYRMKNI